MALDLHPLAIAGYIGIIVTALNLMPFGQLDGGHIIHAMLGQRVAIIVGQMTRIVVVILAFIRRDFFLWAIILLLMPVSDQPALNDVTELDNRRDFLGIFAMVILVSILLPLPKVVAAWLGI
jgi:membrane-associated protease RseP (regulator of RpoE activity)